MKTIKQKKSVILQTVFAFVFLLSALMLSNTVNSQTVKSMDDRIKELKSGELKSYSNEAQKLESLYYDFNPGLVINSNGLKKNDVSDPVVIDVNISDISGLYKNDSKFGTIEMIRINVESKENIVALNPEKLNGFKSLKYIVFQCGFNCNSEFVKTNLITGPTSQNLSVLYLVSIPE